MIRTKLLASLFALLVFTCGVHAQVPETLSYQGYLTDAAGLSLTDPVNVTFSLYGVETGGAPLWSDTQTVLPVQGLFSTELGGLANPFPSGLFDTPLFLGIQVETDSEMTPRTAMTSAAFSQKAGDSETVGGLSAAALDQSADIVALQSSTGLLETRIVTAENDIDGAQADIGDLLGNVSQLQGSISTNQTAIDQLQTDLSITDADLAAVESTLPTLQARVNGTCTAGSSIRVISDTGAVTCEPDSTGPWGTSGGNVVLQSGRVGIGTSAPSAALQVDSTGTDPLRIRVDNSTALRVHTNGSVSVGTSGGGPDDGLYVDGRVGFGTAAPAARLSIEDDEWQMTLSNLFAGGNEWHIGSSANDWSAGGGKLVFSPTNSSGNAALVLDSNRNVGVGTVVPETRLHIKGGSDVTTSGGGFITFGNTTGTNIAIDSNEIMARNNGSAATLALNADGGKVTINSGGSYADDSFEITGGAVFRSAQNDSISVGFSVSDPTIPEIRPGSTEKAILGRATQVFERMYSKFLFLLDLGNIFVYSDESVKNNIRPIPNALSIIGQLEGVTYERLLLPGEDPNRARTEEELFDRANQLGFIAQDVEKVLPQLVQTEPDTGLKAVGYMGVIPVLVEGMKAQQRQIEAQRRALDAQRAEIDALKRSLR